MTESMGPYKAIKDGGEVLPGAGTDGAELPAAERQRFLDCCSGFAIEMRDRSGIGTLGEKTIHAVLKRFFEPDTSCHEIKVGTFFADIVNGEGITEIQTAGFNTLRRKIDAFLPEYPLRIVYPLPARKYLCWYDPETGELTGRRLSPKRGSRSDALFELYKIRPWLLEPGLTLELVFIDLEEHRLLDGWDRKQKRGSTRVDRIPLGLDRVEVYRAPEDYLRYLPDDLPDPFTSADLRRLGPYKTREAQTVLRILRDFGLVTVAGKEGRAWLYRLAVPGVSGEQ